MNNFEDTFCYINIIKKIFKKQEFSQVLRQSN